VRCADRASRLARLIPCSPTRPVIRRMAGQRPARSVIGPVVTQSSGEPEPRRGGRPFLEVTREPAPGPREAAVIWVRLDPIRALYELV